MKSLLNNPDDVVVMILVILDTWGELFALLLGCRVEHSSGNSNNTYIHKITHVSWNPNFGINDYL